MDPDKLFMLACSLGLAVGTYGLGYVSGGLHRTNYERRWFAAPSKEERDDQQSGEPQ